MNFPSDNYWIVDLVHQSFRISSSMTCSSTCTGDITNRMVTLSNLPEISSSTAFSFQINSILSPSNQNTNDKINITTTDGTNNFDFWSVPISSLQPNILTETIP